MIAEQDARGGYLCPEIHLPDSVSNVARTPITTIHRYYYLQVATDNFYRRYLAPLCVLSPSRGCLFHVPGQPTPARAKSFSTTPSTRKNEDPLEISQSRTQKRGRPRSSSDSVASKMESTLTASKRAALGKTKDRGCQANNTSDDENVPKLDLSLWGPWGGRGGDKRR